MNAIADYLEALAPQLRRRRRRRILAEVRAHLLEAAAAAELEGEAPELAAAAAVCRFGPPARVAAQFNAVRAGRATFVRRLSAVMLAGAATASLGTATVWALEPGTGVHAHHHQRHPARIAARR